MAKGKNKKSSKGSGAHNPTTAGGPDSVRGNLGALITEVQKSNGLMEASVDYQQGSAYGIQLLTNVMGDIYNDVHAIAEQMAGDRLKELEAAKEREKMMEDLLNGIKDKKKDDKPQKKEGDFSWLGLAATLISGLVAGGLAFVTNYLKGLQTLWSGIAKALKVDGIIANLFGIIKGGVMRVVDLFSSGFSKVWGFISKVFDSKLFTVIGNFFSKLGTWFAKITGLTGIVDDLKNLWGAAKGMLSMFGEGSAISKFFSFFSGGVGKGFISYFDDLLKFFAPLQKFLGALGGVLGKLAVPIQVIMTIFDVVSGALDGWNKTEGTVTDKLIGAIKGGLTGLVNGLIGGLLDLLKDGLSWILDFFGFQDAAAWLDSFSFSDIISNGISAIVDGIVQFFKDMVEGPLKIIQAVKDLASGNIDWLTFFKQALAGIVTTILAPIQSIASKFGVDITKKALDMLGLSDAGGKAGGGASAPAAAPAAAPAGDVPKLEAKQAVIPQQTQETLQQAQDRLNKAQADGEMSKADANVEKMKLGLRPSFGRAGQNANTNMSAPAVPISSSTTKWDPEDAMARGVAY
jgi:hypothetical protein